MLGDGGARHQATLEACCCAPAPTRGWPIAAAQTPLALARARGYEPMVRALTAAGAR